MIGTRIFKEGDSHWYTREGEPKHHVLTKDGRERATTLADARRLELLPSVTNVLGVVNKPAVTAYRLNSLLNVVMENPRPRGQETEAEWAGRVASMSEARMRDAREFGTLFHAGAARIATNPIGVDLSGEHGRWLREYRDWFLNVSERVMFAEKGVVDPVLGYAGQADLCFVHKRHGLVLADIKTQRVEGGGRVRWHGSWLYQLAAYRAALGVRCGLLSVVVNSVEPEPVVERLWSEEESAMGWDAFRAALLLWIMEKEYRPGSLGQREVLKHGA